MSRCRALIHLSGMLPYKVMLTAPMAAAKGSEEQRWQAETGWKR